MGEKAFQNRRRVGEGGSRTLDPENALGEEKRIFSPFPGRVLQFPLSNVVREYVRKTLYQITRQMGHTQGRSSLTYEMRSVERV